MANPQIEDGYTPIADELLEAMCRLTLGEAEWKVFNAIIRKTYGYKKKKDQISASQLSKLTGIRRENIPRVLSQLKEKKCVIINNDTYINTLSINKNYNQWKSVIINEGTWPKSVITNDAALSTSKSVITNDDETAITNDDNNKEKINNIEDDRLSVFPFADPDKIEKAINKFGLDGAKVINWLENGKEKQKPFKNYAALMSYLKVQKKEGNFTPPPPEPVKPKEPPKYTKEWYEYDHPTNVPYSCVVQDDDRYPGKPVTIRMNLYGYDHEADKKMTPRECLEHVAKINPEWLKTGCTSLFEQFDWKYIEIFHNLHRSEFDPDFNEELPI